MLRSRVIELVIEEGRVISVLELTVSLNGHIECCRYDSVNDLKGGGFYKEVQLIVSGDLIHVTHDESPAAEILARNAYFQESSCGSFRAYCKKERLDELLSSLNDKGIYPIQICLAPFVYNNENDKYRQVETLTWKLTFSGKKLTGLARREVTDHLKRESDFDYCIKVHQRSGNSDVRLLVNGVPALVRNREKLIKRKKTSRLVAGISIAIILALTFRAIYMNITGSSDLVEKKLHDSIEEEVKKINELQIKIRSADSVILSVKPGSIDIAGLLDKAFMLKPKEIVLSGIRYDLNSGRNTFQVEGSSPSPEYVSRWTEELSRIASFNPHLTELKAAGDCTKFVMRL